MLKKVLASLFLFFIVLTTIQTNANAQQPKVVRWQAGQAGSQQFKQRGLVVKRLIVDGVLIEASIRDGYIVELKVDNQGQQSIDVTPQQILLSVVSPTPKQLKQESAGTIASQINFRAEQDAHVKLINGSTATKTVTETTTTVEYQPVPGSMDGSTTPTTVTKTEFKTVPDEDARNLAQSSAEFIRFQGQVEANGILNSELKPKVLPPNSKVAGSVFFYRDTNLKQVIVQVPLGKLTVEFPFQASSKRKLLGLYTKQIVFE